MEQNMEKNVKFSVVTICYNVKDELKRTLRSLWAQTYGSAGADLAGDCGGGDDGGKFAGDCIGNGKFAFGNSLAGDCGGYESIVVDGGSSDGTAAFLRREKRIARYVSEPDRGVYDAMNKGLRLCRGDFVIFMNAGDEFFNPWVLERAAAVLRAHPDCRFLFGDACLVGEDGHCRFREYDAPVTTQNICHQSIFYDRRLFAELGMYDERYRIVADYDFNLRAIAGSGVVPYHFSYPVCRFYEGGLSSGGKYAEKQRADAALLRREWGEREKLKVPDTVWADAAVCMGGECRGSMGKVAGGSYAGRDGGDNLAGTGTAGVSAGRAGGGSMAERGTGSFAAEKWRKLNASFKKKLVYRLGDSAGLFSEINNMFFAMVWALDNKVRFELCSQRSNLGDEGWNDFFEPFTGEKCSEFLVRNNRRFVSDIKGYDKKKVMAGKKKEKIDFLTQDIFKRFFENRAFAEKVFDFPELGIAGGSFAAAAGLARAFYRLNAATETAVRHLAATRLRMVLFHGSGAFEAENGAGTGSGLAGSGELPEKYIAVQMRAGDIRKEAAWRRQGLLGAAPYARKIREMCSGEGLAGVRTVFAFADDFRLVEELAAALSEFRVYTLCGEEERGFDYEAFMAQDAEARRRGILKILANVELCRGSLRFIGTRVSNPSWFLRLIMPEERVTFVDCRRLKWQLQFDEAADGGRADEFRLFGVPLLKVIRGRNKVRVKLFSVLPLYKIRQKGNRRVHYLFGALPVWAARGGIPEAAVVSDAGAGTMAAREGIPEAAAVSDAGAEEPEMGNAGEAAAGKTVLGKSAAMF
jgi:glycosyltransferase involved in cell wall biosynthesis